MHFSNKITVLHVKGEVIKFIYYSTVICGKVTMSTTPKALFKWMKLKSRTQAEDVLEGI